MNAINKYGWENFEHIILATGLTFEEANLKEKEYIEKFNSINNGYNIQSGGQPTDSEYIKPWAYHHKTQAPIPEPPKYIKPAEKYTNLGKGRKGPHQVVCVNTGQVFPMIKDAAEWAGISSTSVGNVCRHKISSAGQHPITKEQLVWQYLEEYLDNPIDLKEVVSLHKPSYNARKVYQLDPETNEILATFDSVTAASKAIGQPSLSKGFKTIVQHNYTAYGYKWRYATDNE